jgi:hypothetical protein
MGILDLKECLRGTKVNLGTLIKERILDAPPFRVGVDLSVYDSCGIVGGGGGPRYVSIALLKPDSVVNWNNIDSGYLHAMLKTIEPINERWQVQKHNKM